MQLSLGPRLLGGRARYEAIPLTSPNALRTTRRAQWHTVGLGLGATGPAGQRSSAITDGGGLSLYAGIPCAGPIGCSPGACKTAAPKSSSSTTEKKREVTSRWAFRLCHQDASVCVLQDSITAHPRGSPPTFDRSSLLEGSREAEKPSSAFHNTIHPFSPPRQKSQDFLISDLGRPSPHAPLPPLPRRAGLGQQQRAPPSIPQPARKTPMATKG